MTRRHLIDFPEIETWECDDLIEKIRFGDCLSVCEDDMPQPDSDDSYNQFVQHHSYLCLSDELVERHERRLTENAERRAIIEAAARARWEKEQRARQQRAEEIEQARREAEEAAKAAKAAKAAEAEARRCAALGCGPPLTAQGSRSYWALVSPDFDDENLVSITVQAPFGSGEGWSRFIYLQMYGITVPFMPGGTYLVPRSVANVLHNEWSERLGTLYRFL